MLLWFFLFKLVRMLLVVFVGKSGVLFRVDNVFSFFKKLLMYILVVIIVL